MISATQQIRAARYGMSIDVDRCNGCGACMVACSVENNVPPAHEGATDRKGLTWIRVYKVDNGAEYPDRRTAFVPVMCQHCGNETPCVHVCPQQAVDIDPATGVVGEMPQRCLGCRYCMAACPYHARYFNWWDPAWPAGMEKSLNPGVSTRMRGVAEKCNLCHGRWHAAKEQAAAAGKPDSEPVDYLPACAEACPTGAILFGDLNDPTSMVAKKAAERESFRLLEKLGTQPKIYYRSQKDWVRELPLRPGRAVARRPAVDSQIDRQYIGRGLSRCSLPKFLLWTAPWAAMLLFGLYSAGLCLVKGLNQTNMDNRFAFGLWIFLDLTVIALGAGAFFTGFLLYILKIDELRAVINSAVVIGLVCYSGAVCVLAVDVGQPLRFWFTFWYPNVHSMLTEVTFCITCYLTVLAIEYLPLVLRNRKLRQVPAFLAFEFELHKLTYVLAGVGTFLSFFHQGSLGGLYGVLRGRPFAFREGLAVWPSTFFLFILSAAAVGPSFILLTTWAVQRLSHKQLVRPEVLQLLGRISGSLLAVYVLAKSIDTLVWINRTSPETGFQAWQYYSWKPFGSWLLIAEIGLFGMVPALILLAPKLRRSTGWLVTGASLACLGVALNRFVLTVQTLALPTLSFDRFLSYSPSWQEVGTFLAVVAYGVLVYSFSFRYFHLFPQERNLRTATPQVREEEPELVGRH